MHLVAASDKPITICPNTPVLMGITCTWCGVGEGRGSEARTATVDAFDSESLKYGAITAELLEAPCSTAEKWSMSTLKK